MKKVLFYSFTILLIVAGILYFTLIPIFDQKPKTFHGLADFSLLHSKVDINKKTVFIVANNNGTELFDLMAPFYLFNATQKANVYVISEKKEPILLVNTLFILPHYTFSEIDSFTSSRMQLSSLM